MSTAAYAYLTSADAPARAIIYARVSSDKQGRGRSVREQEDECRRECARRGWPVGEVLVDNDRSASKYATKARPEFERLRTILRPGDVLVCWEASRLSRDMASLIALRDLCLDRDVQMSYGGALVDLEEPGFIIDGMMAEQEARKTRERVMRAQRANVAAGRPNGALPYGYRIVRDPDTGKSIGREPHPAEAPLLQEAARRVLDGQSAISVVAWLNASEAGSGKHPWTLPKLKWRLTNAAYAGMRTVANNSGNPGTIVGKATWPGLWDMETHDNLVALYAARATGTRPRGSKPVHLLTRIAVCAVCGEPTEGAKVRGHRALTCPSRHMGRRMDIIDAEVTKVIEAILSTPETMAAMAETPGDPVATAAAGARVDELRDRLAAIEEQLIDGTMPAATGARITARITAQIAEAEAAAAPVYESPVVRDLATAPDPVAAWHALPLENKREFIRATLVVTVGPVGPGRWHAPNANLTVEPRERAGRTV